MTKKKRWSRKQLLQQFIQHLCYYYDTGDSRTIKVWVRQQDIESSLEYLKILDEYASANKSMEALCKSHKITMRSQ